jgi:hypothetical protein
VQGVAPFGVLPRAYRTIPEELGMKKDLSQFTTEELAQELLRRFENAEGVDSVPLSTLEELYNFIEFPVFK